MNTEQNILIVEDEFIASQYLKMILKKYGYTNIYDATSCHMAQEILKNYPVDFIFMDINLHGVEDGIVCAQHINEGKEVQIPIIYTTAHKEAETITEARENTNMYGYLLKPFDQEQVFAALSMLDRFRAFSGTDQATQETLLSKNIFDFKQGCLFDFIAKTLTCNGSRVTLTKRENQLIQFMCKNQNQYISYEVLRNNVWSHEVSTSTIRDTFYRLKLKIPVELPIQNVPGLGYILDV